MGKIDFAFHDRVQHFFTSGPEAADFYQRSFRHVQMEEQLGFRYHFIIEHQGGLIGQVQSPTVYLAALAQHTSTIRIGAMIFLMPFYNPMRLAQDAALLDVLSQGRLEFGAGVGVLEHEFMRWSIPYLERREMATEALEIVKKAWTEEFLTYEGKYWQFDEAIPWPRPYQKPHPAIWWGGLSSISMEYAAAYNYNVGVALEPDPIAAELLTHWRRLWRDAEHKGPMPHSLHMGAIYVAETDKQAREEAEPYLVQAYTWSRREIERTRIGTRRGADTAHQLRAPQMFKNMTTGIDYWLDTGLAHVGSPETVIQRLEKQQQLMGYDTYMADMRFGPIPDELVEKSMTLFGEKVIPAFS